MATTDLQAAQGQTLKMRRQELREPLEWLADKLQVQPKTIWNWENGVTFPHAAVVREWKWNLGRSEGGKIRRLQANLGR